MEQKMNLKKNNNSPKFIGKLFISHFRKYLKRENCPETLKNQIIYSTKKVMRNK